MEVTDVRGQMTDGGRGRYDLDPARVTGIAIHHSVTFFPTTTTPDDETNHLLMIDRYHAGKGWGGFGYHMGVFPSGNTYLCGSLTGARAHVASRNDRFIGIVLIGDFTSVGPSDPQISSASDCVAYVRGHYPRRPIGGHRDYALPEYPTACPGDTYQQWLARLNTPVQQETEEMDKDDKDRLVRIEQLLWPVAEILQRVKNVEAKTSASPVGRPTDAQKEAP